MKKPPQPARTVQKKPASKPPANDQTSRVPVAPAAYRPQPQPRVLQRKTQPDTATKVEKKLISAQPKIAAQQSRAKRPPAAANQVSPAKPVNAPATAAGPNAPVIQRAVPLLGTLMFGAVLYGLANWRWPRGGGGQGGQNGGPPQNQQPPTQTNQQPLAPITAHQQQVRTVTATQHQATLVTPQQQVPLVVNNTNNTPPLVSNINNIPTTTTTSSGMPPRRTALEIFIEQNQQRNANVLGLMKDCRQTHTTFSINNNNRNDEESDGDEKDDSYTGFRTPKQFKSKSKKMYDKGKKGGVACYLNGSKNPIEQGHNSNIHQHAERLAVAQAISKGMPNSIALEQNAWPCEYCHPWLRNFARESAITIIVTVTDDHGGYANWHKKTPGSSGVITYNPNGTVVYQ